MAGRIQEYPPASVAGLVVRFGRAEFQGELFRRIEVVRAEIQVELLWQVLTRLRAGGVADDILEEGLAPFVPPDDTVANVIQQAAKAGLVEHQGNEYRLTPDGLDRAAEVEEKALGDLDDRAYAGIPAEEQEALLATLERVATNLGWQPA